MAKKKNLHTLFYPAIILISFLLSFINTSGQTKKPTAEELFKQAQFETNVKKDYDKAIQLCKRALKMSPANTDIRQLLGKLYLVNGYPDLARVELKRVLARQPGNIDVLNNLISIELSAKNYTEALRYINSAVRFKPDDIELKLKKADIYALQNKYTDALFLSEKLFQSYPQDKKIRSAYVNHLVGFSILKLKEGDTAVAISGLEKAYQFEPGNKEIMLYMVNISYLTGNFDKAIDLCNLALVENQHDTTFLIKKSSILMESEKYNRALKTSLTLLKLDSNNIRFRQIYLDQLMVSHKKFTDSGHWNSSLDAFRDASKVIPNDSLIYATLSIICSNLHKYDSSLYYSELGLMLIPDDPDFLLKKVTALEALGKYKSAYKTAGKLLAQDQGNLKYREYAMSLKSKSYKNQVGLLYLHSMFNKDIKPADIATFQYLRFHKKGSIGTRVNYGRRASGEGVMLEAESYFTHNKKFYSYALAGWSPTQIFPGLILNYSLFSSLGKGWELETGSRYLYADSSSTISGVLSMGKYWRAGFTNLRGFLVYDAGNWFQSYMLTHRFYLGDKKDFISLFGNVGSIPDDRSRNFLFNTTLGFSAWSAGIGFQKTFSAATTINITGVWMYQKTSEVSSYNQYDIYLSLLRRF